MACPFYSFKDNDYHCGLCGHDVDTQLYKFKCRDWDYDTCPIYNENEAVGTCHYDSVINKVCYTYETKTVWNAPTIPADTPKTNFTPTSRPVSVGTSGGDDFACGCLASVILGIIAVSVVIAIVITILQGAVLIGILVAIIFGIAMLITFFVSVKQSRELSDEERIQLDIDEAEYYNSTYGNGDDSE